MAIELTQQNQTFAPQIFTATEIASSCAQAQALIETGAYQQAAAALGDLWQDVGVRPDVKHYESQEKAQILLIIGVLTGWIGSAKQRADAQEEAKNLISESATLYEQLGDVNKWAWARCELGVCYWRSGAYEEARIIYENALENTRDLWPVTESKLTQNLALLEIFSHNYRYAERLLWQAENLIATLDNDVSRGNLYFHRALAQKRLAEEESLSKYLHLALENYQKAGSYYERAKHLSFCASVSNNIGAVLGKLGQYDEAFRQIDKAIAIYSSTSNKSRTASTYDTKAQVYLAEGRLDLAEQAALASVRLLREGDEAALLAESLTTLGTIYARQNAALRARRAFESAFTVADRAGDKGGAGIALLAWLEELKSELPHAEFVEVYRQAEALLGESSLISVQKRLRQLAQRLDNNSSDIIINFPSAPESVKPETVTEHEVGSGFSLPTAVCEFEARHIARALREAKGSVTKAAVLLGVSHQNLSLQLKNRHQNLTPAKKSHRRRQAATRQ